MTFLSPSTPGVSHDASNLLVELMMINKYGVLNDYPWRKGRPLANEWGQVCKVVRRLLKTMKIDPARLAWYIKNECVTELTYEEFGLVKWKVNRIFPKLNLSQLANAYGKRMEVVRAQLIEDQRLTSISSYVPKERSLNKRRKTLTDVIRDLEDGRANNDGTGK